MLHPFEPFKAFYIPRLVEMKKYYLVSQTYHRYPSYDATEVKTGLLLTDYDDKTMAKTHVQALGNDKYAAVLNLQQAAHKAKALELVGPESKFAVFWAVVSNVKEMEVKVNHRYKDHMRRYIDNRTNWRISRDTVLRPSLQLVYGELYLILKYGSQTLRVKFEDIETA